MKKGKRSKTKSTSKKTPKIKNRNFRFFVTVIVPVKICFVTLRKVCSFCWKPFM